MGEVRTLCDLYFHNVDTLKRPDMFLWKQGGQWWERSTQSAAENVEALACGLMALGVKPGEKVVLLSEDRPEWAMADFAILTAAAVTVPIYPTLNAEETAYIANDSDAAIAIVSDQDQANKLLSQRSALPSIKRIIIMDPPPEGRGDLATWEGTLEKGRAYSAENPGIHRKTAATVKPDDLATIIYTSGTTGVPKGVMLTHSNFIENCKATLEEVDAGPSDRVLVFLPLSHSLERMADYCFFWRGCSMAYAESVEKVGENLQEVRPTLMVSVPRLYEKVYARLMEQAAHASGLKKKLIHWSVKVAQEWACATLEEGRVGAALSFKHGIADRLVYKKLREKTGGRLRLMVSGGAPLARDLGLFFFGAGLNILEGYGLSETTPVVTVNKPGAMRYGSVGKVISKVEVRTAEDGELFVRGPNVMKGYYKMPEETAEVLSDDGWFATGDIAQIDEEGFVYITDRKKELIVTAGGKNVAPQPIENAFKTNKYVSQTVLIGDKRPYIAALIVPNWANVLDYAKSQGMAEKDPAVLRDHPVVMHLFAGVLERVNSRLSRYEQVKRCRILIRELTQEAGELTPTMKVKRRVINELYARDIEELYAQPKESGGA